MNASIFISGETVDLCIPTEKDFPIWTNWINNPSVTRYLQHGEFPNTIEIQKDFFLKSITSKSRILLLIKSKLERLIGVVSLSEVDRVNRRAEIATVMNGVCREARYASLEARCLVIIHAFEVLGLDLISGALAYPGNKKWLVKNLAIGFKPEGILWSRIYKNRERLDLMSYSITYEEYRLLKKNRGGQFWPGEAYIDKTLQDVKIEENIDSFYKICRDTRNMF